MASGIRIGCGLDFQIEIFRFEFGFCSIQITKEITNLHFDN